MVGPILESIYIVGPTFVLLLKQLVATQRWRRSEHLAASITALMWNNAIHHYCLSCLTQKAGVIVKLTSGKSHLCMITWSPLVTSSWWTNDHHF